MVNINKINENYNTIEKYLKILEQIKFKNYEEFKSKTIDYLASSMSLFTILNASIEIGEILIEKKELDFPKTYKEIFQILGENNVIEKKLAKKLENFMYQRNMLAHQYEKINPKKIYELLNEKEIFKTFIKETKIHFK